MCRYIDIHISTYVSVATDSISIGNSNSSGISISISTSISVSIRHGNRVGIRFSISITI